MPQIEERDQCIIHEEGILHNIRRASKGWQQCTVLQPSGWHVGANLCR